MRKLFAFAMAALTVLSCSRDSIDNDFPEEGQAKTEKKTVHLTIVAGNPSDPGTRTEMLGTSPLWSQGDQLGVTSLTFMDNELDVEKYDHSILPAYAESFPAEVAEFTGDLELTDDQQLQLWAYYPGIPAIKDMEYPEDYTSITYEEYFYNDGISQLYFDEEFFGIHSYGSDFFVNEPEASSGDEESDIIGAGVVVNKYQHPTSASFDGGSDVLVSKPFALGDCTLGEGGYTMPGLEFARMVSVIKLVLNPGDNGRFEGQHPEWVSLSYRSEEGADDGENSTFLSGAGVVEFPATGDDYPVLHLYSPGWPLDLSPSVFACFDDGYSQAGAYSISAENPIYLLVFPGVLKAGGKLDVTAANMENYYSVDREITLNHDITLKPGKIITLTVGLTGEEDDIYIGEKNLPESIAFETDEVDADQYDRIQITANVIGTSQDESAYLDFDETCFSCVLANSVTGDRISVDYGYLSDTEPSFICDPDEKTLTVNTPVLEEPGVWTLLFSYGSTPEESIPCDPCMITVHEAVELPAALGRDWNYHYYFTPQVHITSAWFDPYRVTFDEHVYLKTHAASSRTEGLPEHAFRGSFLTEDEGGSFEAFKYFSRVTIIPKYAFYSCDQMTDITLPASVTSIDEHAFHYCTGLTGISLPDGLTSIGGFSFSDCHALASVQLPASVTSIGANAFSSCWEISSISLDNVVSFGANAFGGCGLTGNLVIRGDATIGSNAFNACHLQSVTFKNAASPGTIGAGAFYNNFDLAYFVFEGTTPPTIDGDASCFGDTAIIYVPDAALTNYKTAWPTLDERILPVSELPQGN